MISKQSKNKLRVAKKASENNMEMSINRSQMNDNPSQQGVRSGNASQGGSGQGTQSEFQNTMGPSKKGHNTVKKRKKAKKLEQSQLDEFDAGGQKIKQTKQNPRKVALG